MARVGLTRASFVLMFLLALACACTAGAANLVDCGFDVTDAADGSFAHPATGDWLETDSLGNMWIGHTTAVDTGDALSLDYKANFATTGCYVEVNLSNTSRSVGTVSFYYRGNPTANAVVIVLDVNGGSMVPWGFNGTLPTTYQLVTVPINRTGVNSLRWRSILTTAGQLFLDDVIVTEGMKATVTATSPSPTRGGNIGFHVAFDRDTVNFNDLADLNITADPGVSYGQAAITPIDARNFTVQIDGVTGNGQISLAAQTTSDIRDTASNPLLTSTSAAIQIDNTGLVATVTNQTASPTNADTVRFRVQFESSVQNFNDASDLVISGDPTVSYSLASTLVLYAAGESFYTVEVPNVAGDGNLTCEVSMLSDVADASGNTISASSQGLILIDNTAPAATVTNLTPGPTNLDAISFQVLFSEPVLNFDNTDDLEVLPTGVSYSGSAVIQLAPDLFEVDFQGVAGDGTLTVSLRTGYTDVTDLAGNLVASTTASTVVVDNTAPAATVTNLTPSPTNLDAISFQVLFSEPVLNFDNTDDLEVLPTGVSYSGSAVIQLAPDLFEVDFQGVTGDGTLTVSLRTGYTDVTDLAGNLVASTTASTVVVDNTAPLATVSLVTATPTGKDIIEFEAVFTERLRCSLAEFRDAVGLSGSLGFNGGAIDVAYTESPPVYRYAISVDLRSSNPDADGTLGIALGPGLTDLAGNPYLGGLSELCDIFNFRGFWPQPASANLYVGESAYFEAVADCAADRRFIVYHWKWDDGLGKAIHDVGADMTTYPIPGVSLDVAGLYWCEATYDSTSYPSNTAVLNVADHLVISQLEDADRFVGEKHEFYVAASGGFPPLDYTWRKDDVTVPGATEDTLTLNSLSIGDSGAYLCEVRDAERDVIVSNVATLHVAYSVPAAGLAAGVAMAAAMALAGAVVLKRLR